METITFIYEYKFESIFFPFSLAAALVTKKLLFIISRKQPQQSISSIKLIYDSQQEVVQF